jgi:xanthine dehydrogenase accessory factor
MTITGVIHYNIKHQTECFGAKGWLGSPMDIHLVTALAREAGTVALVTILEVRGSAPRHEGSAMLVRRSGEIMGTVGGALGEKKAIDAARTAIERRRSTIFEATMLGLEAEGTEPICGGSVRMLVEFVADGRPYTDAAAGLEAGRRVVLAKRLTFLADGAVDVETHAYTEGAEAPERVSEAASKSSARYFETEGLFLDPLFPEEKLLVVGAGHVGLALARAALPLGFAVSVVDDRPELLREERLGSGIRGIRSVQGRYAEAVAAFPFDESTYIAVMTRGHLHDLEVCRVLMGKSWRYAGVIGSARKAAALVGQLGKDGFDRGIIGSLHSPIGLPIGAETPQEIAVSILAEMIALRRGRAPGRGVAGGARVARPWGASAAPRGRPRKPLTSSSGCRPRPSPPRAGSFYRLRSSP